MDPKKKQYPAVDVTGDRSKLRCCKEQYCIGTWNVRSMNQGKLEVVKQEMARVNVDILGISELKWAGMGEFNSVHILTFPNYPFEAVSQNYWRCFLPGCSPHFAPNKIQLATVSRCASLFLLTLLFWLFSCPSSSEENVMLTWLISFWENIVIKSHKHTGFFFVCFN